MTPDVKGNARKRRRAWKSEAQEQAERAAHAAREWTPLEALPKEILVIPLDD